MSKITRTGVTFPPELLKDFDEIINKMGYESRSKALQDAVRLFVSERKWIQQDESSNQTGIIVMVYDHDARGLEADLTETQHEHKTLVTSTMHIHISEKDCLEAIAVKGKVSEIRKLNDELATKRGVKILKTIITTQATYSVTTHENKQGQTSVYQWRRGDFLIFCFFASKKYKGLLNTTVFRYNEQ